MMMNDVTVGTGPVRPADAESALETHIRSATQALLERQQADGHWVFELEADATIPAEYVLLRHYRGEPVDAALEAKIAVYLRRIRVPMAAGRCFTTATSTWRSVKAYFALKMIGRTRRRAHAARARSDSERGGAANANVFTRVLLAQFDIIRGVLFRSCRSRSCCCRNGFRSICQKFPTGADRDRPLLVLQALKLRQRTPKACGSTAVYSGSQDDRAKSKAPHQKWSWFLLFRAIDIVLRAAEPLFPARLRQRAIDKAVAFVTERLNGEEGLGAIYPAMANSVMMYDVLGYPADHPDVKVARQSIDKLLVIKDDEAYCQPCVSPVWDTVLTCHALLEVGGEPATKQAIKGLDWLKPRQVLDVVGDWAEARPNVRPGGWAFQYANAHYPDLDDTAVVVMAMDRAAHLPGSDPARFRDAMARGEEWVAGLQGRDGGWGAFDADNDYDYLNNIPFADHGALLDPPTADLTGRCLSMLAQLGHKPGSNAAMRASIEWLRRDQRPDGSWYGRWGMNFIYGTWSVLCALNVAGVDPADPMVRKAVDWLLAIQNPDGGWGEDGASYKLDYRGYEPAPSTPSQSAWALIGLMAAGQMDHPAVARGIKYLAATQDRDGTWREERYTATGFPRVFYLRYHGYAKFFPLWALARYRNLKAGNDRTSPSECEITRLFGR